MVQYVYFLYGKDDELLYVGQTNSLKSRIGAHLINHEWSEEIAKAKYIEFLVTRTPHRQSKAFLFGRCLRSTIEEERGMSTSQTKSLNRSMPYTATNSS